MTLSSISCPSLKLLAVIIFEISNSLCPDLQSAIAKKYIITFVLLIFIRLSTHYGLLADQV